MPTLSGKTLFITGASRGIGEAIALRAARDGANIAVIGKSETANSKLPGTLHTAAQAIERAGGKALVLPCDIRFEERVREAVDKAVACFGGIDILVNNASAISLTSTIETEMKRFDLMHAVNVRGTFLCSKACIPHLKRATNPHILNLAPPLNFGPHWFAPHLAYSIAKYGMSLCVLGMAAELRDDGIAVNALWPRTIIATAAVQNLLGGEEAMRRARKPDIVADAAHAVLTRPSRACTGHFYLDEEVLAEAGVTDLSVYAVDRGSEPLPDLFVEN